MATLPVTGGRPSVALFAAALVGSLVFGAPAAGAQPSADVSVIVLLRSDTTDPGAVAREHTDRNAADVTAVYGSALKGYAAEIPADERARLAADPRVVSIEDDQVVTAVAQAVPTGVDRVAVPDLGGDVGSNLTINGVDDVRVDADVAILDTGTRATHTDLNVVQRANCTVGGCPLNAGDDGNGHGTHVGGSVAALDNDLGVVGVAPGARLWSVKVLDDSGNGSLSWVVAGIDWVTARASEIEVANMSLGCFCFSPAMDTAITNSVAAGITYTVAAGNSSVDASSFSPANHPSVITVSALADFNGVSGGGGAPTCRADVDDTLADFSNFGSMIEVAAPGACINSTWYTGGYAVISGTSMASPHVAGAAALLASQPAFYGNPALIRSTLVATGNQNWVDESGDGVQEPLIDVSTFTPVTIATPPPPPQPPFLTITNAWVLEGNAGTTTAAFNLSLSAAPGAGQTFSVKATTGGGSASAGGDYNALPLTTVTFAAGETAKTVDVTVNGDTAVEPNETFNLNLSAAVGLVIADSAGQATIVNDDGEVTGSVSDAPAVIEGNAGAVTATFTVSLSAAPAPGHTVSVKAATANGTAAAGSDYAALPLTTLNFAAGETTKTVDVTVNGDTAFEGNETFKLNLSSPMGMVLADSTGTATIIDEEGPFMVAVNDVSVNEGNGGTVTATFTVSLSAPPGPDQTVSVKVATADGTATAGSDYTAVPLTTLTFAAGETTKTVGVSVNGDTTVEPNETVIFNLSSPAGMVIADSQGRATIVNDDGAPGVPPPPFLTITNAWVLEGNAGTATAAFNLSLSAAPGAGQTFSVKATTGGGSASAGSDYTALPLTTVTFAAGETAKTVDVTVNGDTAVEPNETFNLYLSAAVGLVIADSAGQATIVNDDGEITGSVSNAPAVIEGNAGTVTATFTVSLSAAPAPGHTVSVKAVTANGTAAAGSDYAALPLTTLNFAAGETTKTVDVTVNGDTAFEGNETFNFNLSSPVGIVLADGTGTVTIIDEEGPLAVAVNDVSVNEGNAGTVTATFTVSLSAPPAGQTVAVVKYATADGTATAGSDYTAVPLTTLTFAAGETTKTVGVSVNGDTTVEPNETVIFNLSSPAGMVIADSQGRATIVNDD